MKLAFDVSEEQQKKFDVFFEILIETNKIFDLTAITDENEVAEKHFFDSIQAMPYLKQNATVVDVGAGAGFPGVPLKILRSDLKMTLVDSLFKRVNFLKKVGEKLNLKDFECLHMRAEDFARPQIFINRRNKIEAPIFGKVVKQPNLTKREFFDVGLARAVAPLPTLCELVAPLVKVGGQLILYKGRSFEQELNESQNAFKELGLKLNKVVPYKLQNAKQDRVLIILDKVKATPAKYPRPQNKPKTNPL